MPEAPFDKAVAQRWFAVELNNTAWDWLEAENYDARGAERITHAAHASCYHWMQVGGAANHARAACLVANVYAAVGDGPNAIRHARRCIELSKANAGDLADWDWAFAYDVLARAHAAAGETKQADLVRRQAREYGNKIADEQDKTFFEKWHRAGNWHDLQSDI
ncbi:MAG: hypothetical protein H6823_06615 [Planctomycetaceae bacterium]|nr:hypothetical protein [Planctomycetales bacterium]MCB9937895.1 hypothetical protein [Planctomycetaceae bacterium]